MTPLEAMAWSPDPLVRDIYSEIDDRDLYDIAEAIMEVSIHADRALQKPMANTRLSLGESREATLLASHVIDWANYGLAYDDFSNPPWER